MSEIRAFDSERFRAGIAPIVDLVNRARREVDEEAMRFATVALLAVADAAKATQEDFQLTPTQPDEDTQWRHDERDIDGGYTGCEFPRLWPPRRTACPPVDDPDFPQVSDSGTSAQDTG